MERARGLWIIALVACTAYLTASLGNSFALDRPVHSAVAVLLACAAVLLLSEKIRPASKEQQYAPIPLADMLDGHAGSPPASPTLEQPTRSISPSRSAAWIRCVVVALLLAGRVDVLRRVVNGIECSRTSLETAVPISLALADWWYLRRHRQHAGNDDDMNGTMYGDMLISMTANPWRSASAVALLSWTSAVAIFRSSPARSTYICSELSHDYYVIPNFQLFGVALDCLLAFHLFQSLDLPLRRHGHTPSKSISYLGFSCIIAAGIWIIIGIGVYLWAPPHVREWATSTPKHYTASAMILAIIGAFAVTCALHSINHVGMLSTSVLVLFTSAYTSLFVSGWNHSHPFPPLPGGMIPSLLGMIIGTILYAMPDPASEGSSRTSSKSMSFWRHWSFFPLLGSLFAIQAILAYNGDDEVRYHPIDLLMYNAKERHDAWLKQASSSMSIADAAANYTARYKHSPPPYFEEWYKYAASHSSYIIDDFDTLNDDLLPFWSLSPAEIRQRTWEALADPYKGIGGIIIRNGEAKISENSPHAHQLMLDGMVRMINQFAEWLPDMDLAFNLHDECRVAVPYDVLGSIRANAEAEIGKAQHKPVNDFSVDRAAGWQPLSEEPPTSNSFEDLSLRPTWDEFGSIGCPSDSSARTQRPWSHRNLCTSCALPHSLGQFLSNWTVSADVCHQPDLADLHGFYSSPSTYEATHELMPIFSTSKGSGFNDILHPSPWNYMDKIVYAPQDEFQDPLFADKKNALFWRGDNSNGFAAEGSDAWKGMARQRLVHLITNTSSSQSLLLPYPIARYRLKLRYTYVDPSALHESISTDVSFTDIVNCSDANCIAERSLFNIAPEVDFQAHWGYKYLIDIDDSGASKSFLPFLLSRSLPFKAAIFREWWDGRLTPWMHFVPIDIRMHGLWATLAYFTGFKGVVNGQEVMWPQKTREAERLAQEGAAWARKVLRKEDMEIYMFRLLLEWGRLTDDRRDELGFDHLVERS